jgi:hypothetical protein
MKKGTWFIALVTTIAACSVADAAIYQKYGAPGAAPEIDAASSVAAISLLLGALALVAERQRRRNSAK